MFLVIKKLPDKYLPDVRGKDLCIAIRDFHCLKSARIRSFSGTYFPAFGLNTERCYRLMLKWLTLMWKNFELYRELVMVANLIKKF